MSTSTARTAAVTVPASPAVSTVTPVVLAYTESGSVYAITFNTVVRFNGYGINAAMLHTAPAQVVVGQQMKFDTLNEDGSKKGRSSHKVVGVVPVHINDKGEVVTELTGQEERMVDAVMALSAVGPVRQEAAVQQFVRAEHQPMTVGITK